MKTNTQIQRAASAKIKKYVQSMKEPNVQYYYIRGFFHINNIGGFYTAKDVCEAATGLPFTHFTNSMCKLDFSKIENA